MDYSSLDSIDLTKSIKRGVLHNKPPSILSYLFDSIENIPAEVLSLAKVKQKSHKAISKLIK